jgi:hypothetical protein
MRAAGLLRPAPIGDVTTQPRDPAGRFAANGHAEPDVQLADSGTFVPCQPGRERFEDALAPDDDAGTVVQLSTGTWGIAAEGTDIPVHQAVRNNAAAACVGADLDETEARLRTSGQVTILTAGMNGRVYAREGSLADAGQQFRPRGRRLATETPALSSVIGVMQGHHGRDAVEAFGQSRRRKIPELVPVTDFDGIPLDDGWARSEDAIAAVYMLDHGIPGSPVMPGCMFFADSVQADDDGVPEIVNGYFWAPEPQGVTVFRSQLSRETGSFYADDLMLRAGRVRDYVPGSMTMKDCFSTLPDDRVEAYRRVLGVSHHGDANGTDRW